MNDYEEVRSNLIKLLEELNERLAKICEDVKHTEEPLPKDFAEQATEMENSEVLDSLGNAARDEMVKVKQAIARIDNGDYSICVACGEPIGQARLKVLPFTDKCIKCANMDA